MKPVLLEGLSAAAPRFDVFALDQYGVLHNGTELYPAVLDCLAALRDAGKRVFILSNSGKRKESNAARLTTLGIPPELYEDFVTSGEVARAFLGDAPDELRGEGGNSGKPLRCLALGGAAERALLDGLDIDLVDDVSQADFMLLASFGEMPPAADEFLSILIQAGNKGLTLVCANPDVTGITADGLQPAPGALAASYEEAGGRVLYVGKPHPLVYRSILEAIAPTPADRVLAIGDSLAHDVAGAAGVGMASALILQGIHCDDLGSPDDGPNFENRLARLTRHYQATPGFLLRSLAW
ncbi:TIGR01459 family HAD-type hydrolase [Pelagibius litoralis]|uniref:TIGR01459 family HAD-type hydrolase n=1 Tax=Pelagibius litoralis TaxID=374515 RepID=A0A967KEB6_9PROT|nr:TIGR01459 family HAD-type hydrolase [Pelagibius litoralis]NIA70665.1 TIGR01459 family HAD-type hydrolase [Pelagibius litoralis]